ncbi:MAG TPA: hypothetical protein VL202_00235 [Pararhizobium sp.]|uniref:hypothetical protein n=1 Tax=Pararhizobium sp. TaxID=1977563 RepID=UPI002B9A0577|nr:hypothetical protein [Pararhizobium sp.]HTO29599.1 hypothetical protein [Pararhizobium sp.]
MIEFALLFALGFLTAVILGLLVAPAVYKRITRFAEDRLKATMPLSPQEVRAQKDAARAGYAAENARTSQALKRERDKNVHLLVQNGAIQKEAQRVAGENADLHTQLADMNVEAADLRSAARQQELNIERLKATLADLERDNVKKGIDIKTLTRQLDHVSAETDSLRIDVAAYDAEAENLKSRMAGLRDEREKLREELKAENAKGRELEARLARDGTRIRQLDAKLGREIASNADKDSFLERRAAEIERLKAKIKESGMDLRDASRALRAAGLTVPTRRDKKPAPTDSSAEQQAATVTPDSTKTDETKIQAATVDLTVPTEYVRNRAAVLADRLTHSTNDVHDDAIREEIADIAATMVMLTAAHEGSGSPIPALLKMAKEANGGAGMSLARRSRDMLPPDQR